MMNTSSLIELLKKYDYTFIGTISAIFLVGVVNLYSATHASAHLMNLYKTQLLWYVMFVFVSVSVSFVRPKNLFRLSYFSYVMVLFLLVLVLFLGVEGMGAKRWIQLGGFRIQPSELMKIGLVLALARWFSKREPDRELEFKDLIMPFLITFVPMLLIVIEPDLGTGLVLLLVFAVIIFYRRLKWKTIGILAILGLIAGGVMYQFGLKDYQKRRIVSFLDPSSDAQGSGYNAIQSKIAIGSGQGWGKGFKKSSQASLSYLPENHTDFVFSIFNEEHGFFGSLFLISLYLVLFFRLMWLASSVPRIYDSIVIIGIVGILFWHTFINMAMVTGMLPIVGLPLPFMSYGGSSLLTFGVCCGLATSISNSRNLFQ